MKPGVSIWIALIMLVACNTKDSKSTSAQLARVGQKYLYADDLSQALRSRSPLQDSAQYVKELINSWVKQQVLLQQAEKNLSKEQLDTRKKLEDYHQSLLIYEYEKQLLNQQLDTVITEAQILAYFKNNKSNFELKKNLIRLKFVKTEARHKDLDKIRNWLKNDKQEELISWCKTNASNYFLDESVWLDFADVLKEIPIRTYNEEAFLNNNTYTEVKDGDFLYIVRIMDYRIRNTTSDPGQERERIKEMILNQRKVKLLKTMEQNMIKEAELSNNIEIF
ncbi:MAG TPA: hypothetical protein VK202_06005 [Bacteroidia bacterium]|nr:hypothetical protein [Bacteroidia bacterium]